METEFQPQALEADAQAAWEKAQAFDVSEDLGKEKFYCLSMFPYPSGNLHMGHVRNYSIGDVIARYQRMCGKNVLQPIGWDAFGLPAENAAIKHKVHPAQWTKDNIATMRKQLKRLGFAYDWSRELTTCDPSYYRWEQWFFTKLFEKGLVYKKNSIVNWDPVDQTVLANEQVVDGCGWRSGAPVERREIPQWFLKITDYADELLDDLDTLEGWPDQVRTMQRNWIGRSHGVNITFNIATEKQPLSVFTTRADTLYGCTYLAIAAEHPLAIQAAENNPDIAAFLKSCKTGKVAEAEMATMEKSGIDSGITATHPLTGDELPIWIANFVLMEYGSGAVMSVPAHDQRDWEFAQKYQLPIKPVIEAINGNDWDYTQGAYTDKGRLINCSEFSGLSSSEGTEAITDALIEKQQASRETHYRIRDWGVSRQRYWGTPIPMINCETCGSVAVPESDLPVCLPENIEFTGAGSPLAQHPEFYETSCPKCGKDAKRETDTFDTFMESSWYYARFTCVNQEKAMLDGRAGYWTPVDHYVGGIEHAVMHLLYARFIHKLLRDMGLVNSDEPFKKLLTQGMVLKDGAKMSKSKGNTVDPNHLIGKYGADTVRLFTIFASPPEQSLEWSDTAVEGCYRYLKRLWYFAENHPVIREINESSSNPRKSLYDWSNCNDTIRQKRQEMHKIIQQILYDYERTQFNTVVSGCMKLLNLLHDIPQDPATNHAEHLMHEGMSKLLRLLAPITPHVCHALWQNLDYGKSVIDAPLPKVSKEALKLDVIEFVVQVNGKLRGHVKVAANADETAIQSSVLKNVDIAKHLENKTIRKTIVIAKRQLINLVVTD